jgi:hypothetical protein
VAVRQDRVDRGRLGNQVERALDPFVEDRVRTHLDAVERARRRRRRPAGCVGTPRTPGERRGRQSLDERTAIHDWRLRYHAAAANPI